MQHEQTMQLIELLKQTSEKFRLGKEAEASQMFRQCINILEQILKYHGNAHHISALLPMILEAQERHDWLGLADYLEYEIPSLLTIVK
ncbi:hypothetical protein LMH66_08565 [Shewanella sp. 10N.7]|uniref:hypothetical protein n=1 Tax=Shewanella sp. 10N.7 TaxID=2885093 RepID=UPI001E3BF3C5|nr:hypothetical protein [Shewanella sp. 10N.7]MCC4832684.1 hypothetical protein [Shewanella sp. 10N.7]